MLAELRAIAGRNRRMTNLIGLGYHGTITPPVILRNVLENPAWYTAYTPYQPEISQGRLEALLNFQTMIADLTGMDVANASMLDEATAAAEAMAMAHRQTRHAGNAFFVHSDTHPQTIAVLRTRAEPVDIELVVGEVDDLDPQRCFGALFSTPTSTGALRDFGPQFEAVHAAGGLVVVAADLLSLVLLRSPGEAGADIVVGSAQRFGVPIGFGGPHAGYLATRAKGTPAPCRAGSSGSAPTPADAPRCASRCRRANSTSAGRRRRPTSARRRCCWPTSPASTPHGTGRTGCSASPSASTG